jgi:hypothetical protein
MTRHGQDIFNIINLISVAHATPDDVKWIAELEGKAYTKSDAVPYHILRKWYKANPTGFFIIKYANEHIGHIDILPLKPEPLKQFIVGRNTNEKALRETDIYSQSEVHLITDLYIESIIVTGGRRTQAMAILKILSSDNVKYMVSNICPIENADRMFAIAASNAGDNIMRRLGFTIETDASVRDDGHNMYVITVDKLIHNDRLSNLLRILSTNDDPMDDSGPSTL